MNKDSHIKCQNRSNEIFLNRETSLFPNFNTKLYESSIGIEIKFIIKIVK